MVFDIAKVGEIRKRLGLTQKQFANRAGVSQSMIAKIEAGRMDPSYSSVRKIEALVNTLSREKEADAKEIMVRKIISVEQDKKAREVIEVMGHFSISQVPVLDGDNVIGMITETSILNRGFGEIDRLIAKDMMVEPPPILSETAKISVVGQLLKSYPLVLIKKEGKLVGLITKADLLKTIV